MTTPSLALALSLLLGQAAPPPAGPAAAPAAKPAGAAKPAAPYRPYGQRPGEGGHLGAGARGHGGAHGNPADLDAYMAAQEAPGRDAWQQPDRVVQALGLGPGRVACDVGAGPGYFTIRLARAVGAEGRVFAVDVEPAILARLRERLGAAGLHQVTPVLALGGDPLLPAGACDVVLVVNTYHHFADGPAYLRKLAAALRPGGRIVNVDFHKRETGVGPAVAHRVAREAFLADAAAAGLSVQREETFLPHQYLVVLSPAAAAP